LFDIVDRMQLPAAGVFPWARAEEESLVDELLARSRVKPVAGMRLLKC